ncbi:arginine--tRNA ligase [Nocardia aurea]|uniref:arginine--tRNA ligase n=1 Tax=Nocardia aurea TaxID=2144174 RepID=UPI00339F0EF6
MVDQSVVDQSGVRSLNDRVSSAVTTAIGRLRPHVSDADAMVRRSAHADFQSGAAMALTRRTGLSSPDIAAALAAELEATELLSGATASGPGFLNLSVTDRAVWGQITARLDDPRLGVAASEDRRRTVVDYSGPNIAKEMHVGHLRTTIIGDCLVRVLDFLGATVIRRNHLGDWGTQFGMLIQYLTEHPDARWRHGEVSGDTESVSALDGLYKRARAEFDADAAFAERARARVVALQSGEAGTRERWREIVTESERAFAVVYARLGVLLTPQDSVGESSYAPVLADTVEALVAAGIAVDSEGALVILSEEVRGPDDRPVPLMVRKSDGGYGYDTTDLAALRQRIDELGARRLLYVTDSRQALHFRLIFEAARRAGWLTDDIEAEHIAYGTVLGPDGRPFKTRAGGTVRLLDLLDDAVAHAEAIVTGKNPELPATTVRRIAEQAGIGAVKYADLSTSRIKDYTFDPARMVALNGNTSVYLQYAHARIRSILRKAANERHEVDPTICPEPAERSLALELDGYATVLAEVGATLEPHRLCGYLYDLARAFTAFYDRCPVLTSPEPVRGNRLALCSLTARTLEQGLGLLGIDAPERM